MHPEIPQGIGGRRNGCLDFCVDGAEARTGHVLTKTLVATGMAQGPSEQRAKAIYAAVAGAQRMARGRFDIALFDGLMDGYRSAGLLLA